MSKQTRDELASLSFTEKIKILEKLRRRDAAIAPARAKLAEERKRQAEERKQR